ncbi:blastopia polyprotein [Trichonephila clavipes]|nr:blastopia polyprotein [Trichonephila clavipes]
MKTNKPYNKHRKLAYNYKPGDTVPIQCTQFGTGLKLRPKYFGPFEVTKVNKHDLYEVQKTGQHKGPNDARVDVSYSQTTSEAMNELKSFEEIARQSSSRRHESWMKNLQHA